MRRLQPLFILLLLFPFVHYGQFSGNDLLKILGETPASQNFEKFKSQWHLNANFQNTEKGIELKLNRATNKIDTLVLSGYSYTSGNASFKLFTSAVPFGIVFSDNVDALQRKTGSSSIKADKAFLLQSSGTMVLVNYFSYGKIQYLKFFSGSSPLLSGTNNTSSTTTAVKSSTPVVVPVTPANKDLANAPVPKAEIKTSPAAASPEKAPAPATTALLKNAILKVFRSFSESSFSNLKTTERKESNTWNYKYTYNTNVKIPGEKYNMVYSFPFVHSQLDFVSVLEETDKYDKSFEAVYKSYEKQLTETLKPADGWTGKCMPNYDKSPLSDVEFKHTHYGSVILDYSKTPKGKHILYLRFLPNSF
ncbi:MAG: hypothetical protein KIS94_11080 [Chitinophagales bacterium]|nr:hypothetical protein [Chitinophagales bacterium]